MSTFIGFLARDMWLPSEGVLGTCFHEIVTARSVATRMLHFEEKETETKIKQWIQTWVLALGALPGRKSLLFTLTSHWEPGSPLNIDKYSLGQSFKVSVPPAQQLGGAFGLRGKAPSQEALASVETGRNLDLEGAGFGRAHPQLMWTVDLTTQNPVCVILFLLFLNNSFIEL